jgi:hypothetical protein
MPRHCGRALCGLGHGVRGCPRCDYRSPVAGVLVRPYCGAVGVSDGWTVLLTNGSSAHSEISWLSAQHRVVA